MEKVGVVLLAFGEPEGTDPEGVIDFLEGIFLSNRKLEAGTGRKRARELAEARAPGLMDVYRNIGGSPMNEHAHAHGEALEDELRKRGQLASVFVGTQFTKPSIADALGKCRDAEVDRVVALPLYPICGPTTTLAALNTVHSELDALEWEIDVIPMGGWHRHPDYVELRADDIRSLMSERGLELGGRDTCLYFSAHGTPVSYLQEGSHYQEYVEDSCRLIAQRVGVSSYELGYQNHTNRPVQWTEPSNEALLPTIEGKDVVMVPVSFIHEQSETLDELDIELKEIVEARGMGYHRVRTPHAHPGMRGVLADMVIGAVLDQKTGLLNRCLCQGREKGRCASRCKLVDVA